MIKVNDEIIYNEAEKSAKTSFIADTKSEVVPGATYVGFPEGYKIAFGSTCITTSGDLAFMKSDGTWNWGD